VLSKQAFCGTSVDAMQLALLHSWPTPQSALVVQAGPVEVPGAQVPFWQVVPGHAAQSAVVLHRPVSVHEPLLQ
jgi:hypothetical protein